MTTNKTYNQLWWDEEFVKKRIQEQDEYIRSYPSTITWEQLDVLRSAFRVRDRFERQLKEIQKLKGHCCRYY